MFTTIDQTTTTVDTVIAMPDGCDRLPRQVHREAPDNWNLAGRHSIGLGRQLDVGPCQYIATALER